MTSAPPAALEAERVVRAQLAMVRQALATVLARQGFKLTAQQLTVIEARRGSSLAGTLSPRRTPIDVSIAIDPIGSCCRVRTRLTHPTALGGHTSGGVAPVVAQLLGEAQTAIDHALADIDREAALRFPAAVWTGGEGGPVTAQQADAVVATGEEMAVGKVGAALAGTTRGLPDAWRQHEGVLFAAPGKVAYLPVADTQAHLAVAAMVVGQPGSLPPELGDELQRLAVRIEHALAGATTPLVRIEVADDERKVIDFMHQQVRIRSELPVRTLQRCRDCRFEKVTNPDLAALTQRNKRLRSFTSAFGATLFRGGISPFVLVGTLFQLKSLDPDYVCPRCQGVSADATLVTFCPGCGELHKEAVLRGCEHCGYDFRGVPTSEQLWVDPPEVAAAALPVGVPTLAPGGGALCRTCGGEFTALWRVVVLSPEGQLEEWFVCASSPLCSPPSLTDPVSVPAPKPLPPPRAG